MVDTLTRDCDTLRESLHEWQAEQELLAAEWSESLSALAAYQSHLDDWQHSLVEERDTLRREQDTLRQDRETLERERSAAELNQEKSSSQSNAQLAEARAKVAQLSELLLTRTEELRLLDQNRAELTTELEVARTTTRQMAADADQQKKSLELERLAWTEQLQHLRELLEQRAAAPITGYDYNDAEPPEPAQTAPAPPRPAKAAGGDKPSTNNPVLGSIMEQFGKLRQQRATDRQTGKLSR